MPTRKKTAAKKSGPKKTASPKAKAAGKATKPKAAAKVTKPKAVAKSAPKKAASASKKSAVTAKKAAPSSKKTTRASKKPASPVSRTKTAPISAPPTPVSPPAPVIREVVTERDHLIQDIRRRLLEEKARLVADAEATRNDLPDDETYPDLGDQATAETDRSFMLRLRSRESKLIKKIDDTIDLIDKGEYGTCEECGEEIDSRRLQARPVTTYCIECKTRQEEDEKLR